MNERLVTAGGALLALAAAVAIFVADSEAPITPPTAEQNGPNGYLALNRWLQASGVRTVSYRHSALELGEREAGNGHLFITAMPHRAPLRTGEAEALRAWAGAGNTLLISVALNDTPPWASGAAPTLIEDVEALVGLRFEPLADVEVLPLWGPETIAIEPLGGQPAVAGVGALQAETAAPTSIWQPKAMAVGEDAWQAVARLRDYDAEAIWHRPLGAGHVYLVALGSLLTNRGIGEVDNGRFFANVANARLAPGGTAIFDDFHQGLSALYAPSDFFADSRLHVSIAFLLALWLLYLVGTWNRLAPPAAAPAVPGQLDFVRAAGGFLARKLHRSDAARLLFAARFGHLAGRRVGLREPPWQRLGDNPSIPAALVGALREDYRQASAGRRVNLVRLRNRLRATTAAGSGAAPAGDGNR